MPKLKKIPSRVSELTKCFYCGTCFPTKSKEHVFNSSWGGSHKTGNLICDNCNISFSEKVDQAFTFYTTAVMNSWSFRGERHKEVPKIILENNYFLDKGAKLKFTGCILTEEALHDGSIKIKLSFNSKDEARKWVREGGISNLLGREASPEEIVDFQRSIKEAKVDAIDAEPQPMSIQLNLRDQYRSASHTVLKCLAFFMPEWISDNSTKAVQNFARYDNGDWRYFAVNTNQHISIAEKVAELLSLGVYHNSVEIYFSSWTKMIVGVLTILNRIKRAVVISQNYSGSDAILYVVENTDCSKKPPEAILYEFASNELIVPLLDIQYFSSPKKIQQYFEKEVAELTSLRYPFDAITADLVKGIGEINDSHLILDEMVIEKYIDLFCKFFVALSKIVSSSESPICLEKVRSKLFVHGFCSIASEHIGKQCTSSDIQQLIGIAFENTLKDFSNEIPKLGFFA